MSALLINRDGGFVMPADGWYQLAPLGEFAHAQAGVVQVVDRAACEAMAARFAKEAQAPNFAGALIDFDHFSLDGEKRSEAAGWITALEARCEGSGFGVQGSGGEGWRDQEAVGRSVKWGKCGTQVDSPESSRAWAAVLCRWEWRMRAASIGRLGSCCCFLCRRG